MMDRIARRVQEDPLYFATLDSGRMQPEHTDRDAISAAACQVADTIGAAAIVSFTSATTSSRVRTLPGAVPGLFSSRPSAPRNRAASGGAIFAESAAREG